MESASPPPDPPLGARSVVLFLCAAVALFLWAHLLAGGKLLLLRDVLFDALPWRRFAAESIGAGHVPLWNPYSRFGQPFVANPQSAVFYPPHLLFNLASPVVALQLTLGFHLLVAALSMFALARFWRLDRAPAAIAAVTYAFGGYMTANLEFMSVFETLAWCPLTLLLTAHLVRRRRVTTILALALVVALQILPGNPQPAGFTLLLCAAYAVAVALRERDLRTLGAVAASGAAVLALAVGLCMLQIAPTLELLPLSVRAGGIDTGMDIASMPPRHLLTLLFPFVYGQPLHERWFGQPLFEFWLGSMHVGIVPLVLASFALLLPRGDRLRAPAAFGLATVAVGIVIALGDHTFVYPLLARLPGFDRVRWPAKALQLVAVALPLLAAIGMQALSVRRRNPQQASRLTPVRILGAWAVVGVALFLVAPSHAGGNGTDAAVAAVFLALTAAAVLVPTTHPATRFAGPALVVFAFANLFVQSGRIHPTGVPESYGHVPRDLERYRERPQVRVFTNYSHAQYAVYGRDDPNVIRNAVDALAGESSLPFHVFKTYGGDALQISRTKDVTDLLANPQLTNAQAARLANVTGLGFGLAGPPFEEFASLPQAPALRWETLLEPAQRAYCAEGFIVEADPLRAMGALLSRDIDALATAVVDPSTPAFEQQPIAATGPLPPRRAPGFVRAVRYDWNRVGIDVEVQRECMLVLTDTWFPGWTARTAAGELPIHRVNVIFRGVMLAPGAHAVEFRYEPASFDIGLTITIATGLLMLLLFVFRRRLSAGSPGVSSAAT